MVRKRDVQGGKPYETETRRRHSSTYWTQVFGLLVFNKTVKMFGLPPTDIYLCLSRCIS